MNYISDSHSGERDAKSFTDLTRLEMEKITISTMLLIETKTSDSNIVKVL